MSTPPSTYLSRSTNKQIIQTQSKRCALFSLEIIAREAGSFILPAYPGLIVKDSHWRWPERNLAGNAIDFHVQDYNASAKKN